MTSHPQHPHGRRNGGGSKALNGWLQEAGAARSFAVPPGRPAQASSPAMPFIGEILGYRQGDAIVMQRRLSLRKDPHPADPAFVPATGGKPRPHRLTVLPMTTSLEVMTEAAAHLLPGLSLLGFEAVRALRWIALEHTDALTLQVKARLERSDESRSVRGVNVGIFTGVAATPALTARLLFGRRYSTELALSFSPLEPHRNTAQRKPFPGLRSIALGAWGAEAELEMHARDGLARSNRPPLFASPMLLDKLGQLPALWAKAPERMVWPVGIDKLELYRSAPAGGTQLPIRMEITDGTRTCLRADFEIQDGAGGVWMRIRGWRGRRFDLK